MRYIIGIGNVSSQGDQCMMILMVDLCLSDVKKTGTCGKNSGGEERV